MKPHPSPYEPPPGLTEFTQPYKLLELKAHMQRLHAELEYLGLMLRLRSRAVPPG